MHIAICDDNVADRKQLERLLGRESDKRMAVSGVFYTDSFGVGSQLFPKRMSYDLFFIDMVEDTMSGLDFAIRLCNEGITMPIVLCSSNIDYEAKSKELERLPDNILFIKKPILKAELSDVLDKAVLIEQNKEKTIEIRHNTDTYYVKEDELVYIEQDGRYMKVHLKDGKEVSVLDSIFNFYESMSDFTHFATISSKILVNATYVDKNTPFKVTLKNGIKIPSTPVGYSDLKILINTLK